MGISSHLRGVSGSLGKFQRRCRRSLVFRGCQGRFRESSLSLEGVSNCFENISGELRGNFESVSGVPWAFQEDFWELQKGFCEFNGTSGVFQGTQRNLGRISGILKEFQNFQGVSGEFLSALERLMDFQLRFWRVQWIPWAFQTIWEEFQVALESFRNAAGGLRVFRGFRAFKGVLSFPWWVFEWFQTHFKKLQRQVKCFRCFKRN